MSRPRLSKIDLWGNLELRLLGVLFLALEMMRKTETGFPAREDSISRILVKYIRRANEKLIPQNMHVDHLPSFQSQNQPDHDLPEGNEAERKKPDFLWEWRDPNEKMDDKRYKYYAIECKRLGTPQSTFCTHYITQGVCRFINLEHSYSKHTSSGTMIGYIQSMIASDILIEVNAEARNYNIPAIELSSDGWKKKGVSRLDHEFDRPEVPPSPFKLRHLWLDLQ
ncbi:MAG TPA: hypothetical protein ENH94_09755 [Phycisphaerales bacterium]|nr:hypothetical protein [Phycisphaerales bacterium]